MSSKAPPAPFWRTKTLKQMSQREWESLCDGCGKCCLHKMEDEESGAIYHTNVACRLLDLETCQCGNYSQRKRLVPDCVQLSPDNIERFEWMPSTCAYRLLAAGQDLPEWHPLVTGDPNSVHAAGVSMRGRAVTEPITHDDDVLEDFLYDHLLEREP
jgi:uncharacterized protein